MGSIELPFLDWVGIVCRRSTILPPSWHAWELPSDPASEEFAAEYQRLLKETKPAPKLKAADRRSYVRGQFGALINDYLATGEFKTSRGRTQAEYTRVCEELQEAHGHKRVRHLHGGTSVRTRREGGDAGRGQHATPDAEDTANFAVDDGVIYLVRQRR